MSDDKCFRFWHHTDSCGCKGKCVSRKKAAKKSDDDAAAGASEGQATKPIMRFNIYGNLINPDPNGMYVRYEAHAAEIAALRERIAGMEKDAERYRHIRATTRAIRDDNGENRIEVTPEQFDEAIDAAIAKEKQSD